MRLAVVFPFAVSVTFGLIVGLPGLVQALPLTEVVPLPRGLLAKIVTLYMEYGSNPFIAALPDIADTLTVV